MNNIQSIRQLFFLVIFSALSAHFALAQTDTLSYLNGEITVGEIKKMERGVLSIETAYSDSDFTVDWEQIFLIKSGQSYLITLSSGGIFNGTINSTGVLNEVEIVTDEGSVKVSKLDIVDFNPIDDTFWNKFGASIDVSFSQTKANNLIQFSTRAYSSYVTERWKLDGGINTVFSSQDSVVDTKRTDANIGFRLFLQKGWSVGLSNEFLQNDEQQLELRSTLKLGLGYYMVRTNAAYFTVLGGLALNSETYTENVNPARESGEAFVGLEFNMFNTGDFSFLTNVTSYPSLTEEGRLRVDFKLDLKYDLPLDFYIKAGTTVNYDNQPVAGAADLDYVIQTGLGWEW